MRGIAAIVLAAAILIANGRCLLACETATGPSQAASPCHHGRQPASAPAPQICIYALVIDIAPSPVQADLVQTGVIAHAASRNVALNTPPVTQETLCLETSPPFSRHLGLSTVLKI